MITLQFKRRVHVHVFPRTLTWTRTGPYPNHHGLREEELLRFTESIYCLVNINQMVEFIYWTICASVGSEKYIRKLRWKGIQLLEKYK
jgi:hypothetical protein